jgi:hypothetical protein
MTPGRIKRRDSGIILKNNQMRLNSEGLSIENIEREIDENLPDVSERGEEVKVRELSDSNFSNRDIYR